MTIAATRTPVALSARAWLACGAASGPLYFLTTLTQAAVRDGFDVTKHPASLLSNGDAGNANAVVMLAFWATVMLAWGWVTAVIFRSARTTRGEFPS
ncbi:hypothetical protein P3102_29400 [Amycolatopsis sp. QT-25]|uniref:hypothetical protein n=1 Tax=Amycolatopsis sp. QT-25 TaxID=3034022 RepID=UPI0023EB0F36|nr:hypothetical protein [Amycolatopsis sp. QT-25]WET78151.1 hypothetical protein P3102_29400 [Amycolatopsis sp. QT-25]